MISMIIVGVLSTVAVPKYIDLKRKANTTKVIGDIQAVRIAVMSFYADSTYFPAESGPGDMPPNFRNYLPIGFSFQRAEWTIDYQRWDAAGVGTADVLIAVTVITKDAALGETTSRVLGNVPQVAMSPSFTFMISGM